MAHNDPLYRLRIPEILKKQISGHAEKNNRSMNAEILSRLKSSLDAEQAMTSAEAGDPYAQVLAAVDTIDTAKKVIQQALLKIGIEKGDVKIEDNKGKYMIDLTNTQKEILTLLKKGGSKKERAILQLLKAG